jgi:hypothetical protein
MLYSVQGEQCVRLVADDERAYACRFIYSVDFIYILPIPLPQSAHSVIDRLPTHSDPFSPLHSTFPFITAASCCRKTAGTLQLLPHRACTLLLLDAMLPLHRQVHSSPFVISLRAPHSPPSGVGSPPSLPPPLIRRSLHKSREVPSSERTLRP